MKHCLWHASKVTFSSLPIACLKNRRFFFSLCQIGISKQEFTTSLNFQAVALRDPIRYKKSSNPGRQKLILLGCWLLSIAATVIIVFPVMDSLAFPVRYSCQVRQNG